jgi:hypothetical protein
VSEPLLVGSSNGECCHMLQESPNADTATVAGKQTTKLNSGGSVPSLNQLSPWLVAPDTATTETTAKPVKHEQPVIHRKTVITTEL